MYETEVHSLFWVNNILFINCRDIHDDDLENDIREAFWCFDKEGLGYISVPSKWFLIFGKDLLYQFLIMDKGEYSTDLLYQFLIMVKGEFSTDYS